ncbi:hypothetical protein G5C51_25105 [Streptomyces sp. A7024]|uniref:Uncharacterized protein n=2 Tax=Streptomyces coryli TaxID=1128680 RepID=A0A6G4U4S5_9ACTN|nr:hypothetical protein [Streptomyces coryli]
MPPETALLESRALRESVARRTEVLDKVKALELLPDGLHVTTRMVADYFEVDVEAIHSVVRRHDEELRINGMKLLRGSDLRRFEVVNLTTSAERYPQGRARLRLFPRRAVLNVAMLLRDSTIARRVRTYLLDAEERARGTAGGFDADADLDDVGAAARDLSRVLRRISDRQDRAEDRMERGFAATTRMLNAIGETLSDHGRQLRDLAQGEDIKDLKSDVRRLDGRVDKLTQQVARIERRRRR